MCTSKSIGDSYKPDQYFLFLVLLTESDWPRTFSISSKGCEGASLPFASLSASSQKSKPSSAGIEAQPSPGKAEAAEKSIHTADAKLQGKNAAKQPLSQSKPSLLRRLRDSHNDVARDQSSGADSLPDGAKQLEGKTDRYSPLRLSSGLLHGWLACRFKLRCCSSALQRSSEALRA